MSPCETGRIVPAGAMTGRPLPMMLAALGASLLAGLASAASPAKKPKASSCAPVLDCHGTGLCDALVPLGWTWDGKACVELEESGCGSAGKDCKRFVGSREDCEKRYAHCGAGSVPAPGKPAPKSTKPRRDVDGDGYDDSVLDGRRLFRGGKDGLSASRVWTPPPGGAAAGPHPGLGFWERLHLAGDLDGDAFADLLVADPACPDRVKDMPACDRGTVRVHRGGAGGPASAAVSVLAAPGGKDTWFGVVAAALGDVDGDGRDDVLLGERDVPFGGLGGRAYVHLGAPGGLGRMAATLRAPSPGEREPGDFAVLAAAGDVNGDGHADVVVATTIGEVLLYPGTTTGLIVGTKLGGGGGVSALAAGDFDGDLYADLAVGRPAEPERGGKWPPGVVDLYRGGPSGYATPSERWVGTDRPGGEFGASLAVPGDLDGDGRDDLVVVASCAIYDEREHSCEGGRARVYLSSPKGLKTAPAATLVFKRWPGWSTGVALVATGDANGDRFADFAYAGHLLLGARGGVARVDPPSL